MSSPPPAATRAPFGARLARPGAGPARFLRCLTALLLLGLASCQPHDPQAEALAALTERGYTLSVAEYHRAAAAGDVPALRLFLESGTAVDVPFQPPGKPQAETALRACIRHGRAEAATFLLEQAASLAAADSEPAEPLVRLALVSGSEPLFRLLLAHKDLPPTPLAPLLLEASRRGELSLIEALLETDPTLPLDTCLLEAVSGGHLALIDFLLQRGAPPDTRDSATGQTPLMRAAAGGHAGAIDLLLDGGASRFLADKEGRLAADHAQRQQHPDAAARLWHAPSASEREVGPLPADHALPAPEGWETATAPAIPLHPPVALKPDAPRPLQPLHFAIVGHHSALFHPPPPRERIELQTVRPQQLPLTLQSLDLATQTAVFTEFTMPNLPYSLTPGQRLGTSEWRLVEVRPAPASAPAGAFPGLALLRHGTTGESLVTVPGVAARSGPLCAVIHIFGTDEYYEAHVGDRFRFTSHGGVFTVTEIEPRQIQFEDNAGRFTIALRPAP